MNPIRSLAPCIVNRSFPEYLWIYFVGPISGVILAVLVYKLVKALEYEIAQDQDPTPALILPLAEDDDRPSSIIPMTSVHSGPPSEQDKGPVNTPDVQLQASPNPHSKT
jgi:aquaporin related protein